MCYFLPLAKCEHHIYLLNVLRRCLTNPRARSPRPHTRNIETPIQFEEVFAVITLAHKYGIEDIEAQALSWHRLPLQRTPMLPKARHHKALRGAGRGDWRRDPREADRHAVYAPWGIVLLLCARQRPPGRVDAHGRDNLPPATGGREAVRDRTRDYHAHRVAHIRNSLRQ